MNPYVPRVLAPCAVPPEPVEDDYAARHGDVDVAETPTRADFRDDVVEAVRAERAAGAFVVSRQRAMRVVLLDTPLLPPGYKGARAWHLFAVGCPPADENPLKLQHCFVLVSLPAEVCFRRPQWSNHQGPWWFADWGSIKKSFECPTGYKNTFCYGPVSMTLIRDALSEWRKDYHQWPEPQGTALEAAAARVRELDAGNCVSSAC